LTKSEKVGQGAFGEVFKGVIDESSTGGVPGYTIACKSVTDPSGEGAKDLLQEAAVMAQVGYHPHLVSLVGVVTSGTPLVLVMSFCEYGSLQSQLKKRALGEGQLAPKSPGALPPKLDVDIALDIAKGMQCLVEFNTVHRDLAARNVLLDGQLKGKVADFGLSRAYSGDSEYYKSSTGMMALRWTAPEAMQTMRFSSKTDVWAFGIVLLEIYTDGDTPIKELTNQEVMAQIQSNYLVDKAPKPAKCPADMHRLMCDCWSLTVSNRPTFAQLIERLGDKASPYMNGYDDRLTPALNASLIEYGGEDIYLELVRLQVLEAPAPTEPQQNAIVRYTSAEYRQSGEHQTVAMQMQSDENVRAAAHTNNELQDRVENMMNAMARHRGAYDTLFASWGDQPWLAELQLVHAKVATTQLPDGLSVVQPNPWATDAIKTTSKRYLTRMLKEFGDSENGPVAGVNAACSRIARELGGDNVVIFSFGKLKQESRIFEKLLSVGGKFHHIRDYARCAFDVKDLSVIPRLLELLAAAPEFELERAKNRFAPDWDPRDSAGYRDYQLLVKTPGAGWIIEVQIIPTEMYTLKRELGHSKCLFVFRSWLLLIVHEHMCLWLWLWLWL
jgi:serine/threonine protein kinase